MGGLTLHRCVAPDGAMQIAGSDMYITRSDRGFRVHGVSTASQQWLHRAGLYISKDGPFPGPHYRAVRFHRRRDLLDALAAHHAGDPMPSPAREDVTPVRLRRREDGSYTHGDWTVTGRPRAWRVHRLDGRTSILCVSLRDAGIVIANHVRMKREYAQAPASYGRPAIRSPRV